MKKKYLIYILISLLITIINTNAANAQEKSIEERFADYSQLLSQEKVYLHTDREVYCAGDTVWFKGYLKNSSELSEFPESNYIYVELIASMVEKNIHTGKGTNEEYVRERVKIKRINDNFNGYIRIPENLNTGISVIRAYTYWMMNREPEYMFYKNIEIRNPIKDDFIKELDANKESNVNQYTEIGVSKPSNGKSNKYDIDIQFMPESGRYIIGKNSVLAFKAINNEGLGVKVNGTLFIDNEKIEFESNRLGMGTININLQSIPENIYAEITDDTDFTKKCKVPLPEESAVVINCQPDTEAVWANICSKNITPASQAYIIVYDASEIYFKVLYDLSEKRLKLENRHLSAGINNIAVIDEEGNIYANRTFFVYPSEREESISFNKNNYAAREKVSCAIDLKDENGNPLSGNFSLSVTDNDFTPYSGENHNIVTYMLMGSELNGLVENPQEYFNKEIPLKERVKNIDYLMLTQAWKYYDLEKILKGESNMPLLGREYTQSISGFVQGFMRTAKRSMVSFLAPSINYTAIGQLDTTGYFALHGLDFPDSTKFIVSAIGMNGAQRRYTPFLDQDIVAIGHSYPKFMKKKEYNDDYKFSALTEYYNSGGDLILSLSPVYVRGVRTSQVKNISPMPTYQFKEGQYRDAHELSAYKSYDLLTYIVSTCPPLKYDETLGYPYIVCRTERIASRMEISNGWTGIIVFINGIQSSCEDLVGMTLEDITGFAYIKGSDASKFNNEGALLYPRSVIMIETKMYDRGATNITSSLPMGWQKPARSYYPKYDTYESKRRKEPMRCTLYWQPNVYVENGKANVEFYTSDHYSNYTLIFEGLDSNRKPVFIRKNIARKDYDN